MAVLSGVELALATSAAKTTGVLDGEREEEKEALIPGLPDEIAEHCLLRLPFPHQSKARSVSSAWNRAISAPSFLLAKKALELSLPYVFVFSFHRSSFRLQWHAFDLRSLRWFTLPPMPLPISSSSLPDAASGYKEIVDPPLSPSAFASAANSSKGELFVLGGMRSDTQTPLQTLISYRASTNSWTVESPMPTPRSFFAAGSIEGKIIAAGGGGGGGGGGIGVDSEEEVMLTTECYDPVMNRWSRAATMRLGLSRYDAAVVGKRMYVTEGWTWPFIDAPRGSVYDAELDCWGEMKVGMREGWTGSSVVLGDKLFVISEFGDCTVKAYDERKDTWRRVIGKGVPPELRKPFAVTGLEGRIYVVASGMNAAIGTVEEIDGGEWKVEWEVVKGPKAFANLSPSVSHVLYA